MPVKCRHLLTSFLSRRSATLRDFQSLIGFLYFAYSVVVPGRDFISLLSVWLKLYSKINSSPAFSVNLPYAQYYFSRAPHTRFVNVQADYLSRFQVEEFLSRSLDADRFPTWVPENPLPQSWSANFKTVFTVFSIDAPVSPIISTYLANLSQFLGAFLREFYNNPFLVIASVALFISYLAAKKLAHSTLCSHISAISYVHKLQGLTDPAKSFLITKLLAAHRQLDIRLPITRLVLHELVRFLESTNSSAYRPFFFGSMFLTVF